MAESVNGDATKKIEIFFAGGVENIRAMAVAHDPRRALIGGEKKLVGIRKTGIRLMSGR